MIQRNFIRRTQFTDGNKQAVAKPLSKVTRLDNRYSALIYFFIEKKEYDIMKNDSICHFIAIHRLGGIVLVIQIIFRIGSIFPTKKVPSKIIFT